MPRGRPFQPALPLRLASPPRRGSIHSLRRPLHANPLPVSPRTLVWRARFRQLGSAVALAKAFPGKRHQ
jgi:hypothetical protein